MAIVDKIHDLTKKLTGQDGVGSNITEAINDLTTKWTEVNGTGGNINEAVTTLSQNAENGGGGGDFKVFKITINADPEVQGSQYYVGVEENEGYTYDGVFVRENGFRNYSPYVGGEGESSLVVDLICFGDSVTNVYLPSMLTASSGAIEYDGETYHYIISGDCSVTGWCDD